MCSIEEHIEANPLAHLILAHLILEDEKASQLVEAHLASCDVCREFVEKLKGHINALVRQKVPGV